MLYLQLSFLIRCIQSVLEIICNTTLVELLLYTVNNRFYTLDVFVEYITDLQTLKSYTF